MTMYKSIDYLNSDGMLTSKQQDALEAKTCEECDNQCGKLDRYDECCRCRDTSKYSGMRMNGGMAYCDTCRNHDEAAYINATTPRG